MKGLDVGEGKKGALESVGMDSSGNAIVFSTVTTVDAPAVSPCQPPQTSSWSINGSNSSLNANDAACKG